MIPLYAGDATTFFYGETASIRYLRRWQ